jgi:tRNA/tmRNA/rRNA uracil-C5-methylase (TrmA/RlmC/RlmD family)
MVAPSAALKARLQQAGLGRKKICFNWKASAAEVKTKLEEVYPKLENGGGFEIMRRGSEQVNDVMVIQPPRSGYSVPFLRDTAGLGQAIAFIRPIQINLDIQAVPVMESSEVL